MGAGSPVARRLFLAAGLSGLWLLTLAGCSNALRWEPDAGSGYHTVREGETIYSIAFRYGLDQRQLAAWNGLGSGRLIFPGQRLRLSPPAGYRPPTGQAPRPSTPAPAVSMPSSAWRWPAAGSVIAGFNSSPKTQGGIHIAGKPGEPVQAAAAGQVVYAGSGLKSYGQLIIIKHDATFLSAYGYNERLLVSEGEQVSAGQQIAKMGEGPGRRAILHFEIRQNGRPVDPLGYLPRR